MPSVEKSDQSHPSKDLPLPSPLPPPLPALCPFTLFLLQKSSLGGHPGTPGAVGVVLEVWAAGYGSFLRAEAGRGREVH